MTGAVARRTAGRAARIRSGIGDPRFWGVQALVLVIFAGNEVLTGPSGSSTAGQATDLAVEALFLAPILYAALNFGVAASLATAGWVTLLVVGGDLSVDLADGRLRDAATDGVMIAVLAAVAVFVAWRVRAEQDARSRYFSLFEINVQPVVLLDASGRVCEANAAARQLLTVGPAPLVGRDLGDLVGPAADTLEDGAYVSLPSAPGEYRLRRHHLAGRRDRSREQVILEDVTAQRRREREATAFARHVLRVQEDERRRVAQEIHDGPVQRIVQLCRQLDRTDEVPGIPAGARAELADARAIAEVTVDELRDVLRGLRPPALEHLGLVPTLQRLVDNVSERAGIHSRLVVEGPARRLRDEVELAAYRIGQEALTNVERHANATSVTVTCRFRSTALELVVCDDGRGAGGASNGPAAMTAGGRYGLRGMAERAELVGGRLDVSPGRRSGTTVRAVLPLPAGGG